MFEWLIIRSLQGEIKHMTQGTGCCPRLLSHPHPHPHPLTLNFVGDSWSPSVSPEKQRDPPQISHLPPPPPFPPRAINMTIHLSKHTDRLWCVRICFIQYFLYWWWLVDSSSTKIVQLIRMVGLRSIHSLIRRCCKAHDKCYDEIMQSEDCPFEKAVYLMSYSVTGDGEKTKCSKLKI